MVNRPVSGKVRDSHQFGKVECFEQGRPGPLDVGDQRRVLQRRMVDLLRPIAADHVRHPVEPGIVHHEARIDRRVVTRRRRLVGDVREQMPYIRAARPSAAVAQGREQHEQASVEFRESRRRHPGVESAIGALQAGNGMERCRDLSQRGYERYVGLGILGRNLHVLGKLLIAQEDSKCQAGKSKRKAVA